MPRSLSERFPSFAAWTVAATSRAGAGPWLWTRPAAVFGLLLLFAAVWIGHLEAVALTPPMDSVEQWVWSHALAWGYHKHPPLPTWALWLVGQLFGREPLTIAILGATCTLASIALMHKMLRQMGSAYAAWCAMLAALCITFYSGRLNYYNHNITLMLCVSLTVYSWWQILQTQQRRWWLMLGLAGGLGMLSKYQYLLVLPPSLVCLAALRPWRAPRHWRHALLAITIALVIFAPHGLWLLSQAGPDSPIQYALKSSKPSWLLAQIPAEALQRSGLWLLDLLLNRCLPALLLLLGVHLFTRRDAAAHAAAAPSAPQALTPERFLLAWGLLPPLSITALGIVLQMDLQLQWGTAFALWLVPAAMVVLRLHRLRPGLTVWRFTAAAFVLIQVLLLAHSHETSPSGCCTSPGRWRNFDSPQIARELDAAAREAAGGQFHVLVGSANEAGAIALALHDKPRVLIDGRLPISPWLSADQLYGAGVVQVFAPGTAPPGAQQLPSGWAWQLFNPENH